MKIKKKQITETGASENLLLHVMNSYEINFRFVCDKYSCWQGIASAFVLEWITRSGFDPTQIVTDKVHKRALEAFVGAALMVGWYDIMVAFLV